MFVQRGFLNFDNGLQSVENTAATNKVYAYGININFFSQLQSNLNTMKPFGRRLINFRIKKVL